MILECYQAVPLPIKRQAGRSAERSCFGCRGPATRPWLVILELKGHETVPPLHGKMFVVRRRTHGHA